MKRLLVATLLLAVGVAISAPIVTWDWTPPTTYENGVAIGSDVLAYDLHCNTTSGEIGPPYEVVIALDDPGAPPSVEDMAPVHNNVPGSYSCAATATSSTYGTTSGYSLEANFTVNESDLGFIPNPPTNLVLTVEN